jgi:thioredoxin
MKTLSAKEFKKQIFDFERELDWKYLGKSPAIIDFYADWCGPCKALSPILEELAEEYKGKLEIYKVDTEASPDLAAAFGIRSIPSILFIPKKGAPSMAAGLIPKSNLKDAIRDLLDISPNEE